MLALLVALSLILITASFGSSGGGLHTVQSGFLDVLSPIESGANKVLTPVHELFKWVNDIVNASDERDRLKKRYSALLQKYAAALAAARESTAARALANLDASAGLKAAGPVSAHVIGWRPSVFVRQVNIDVGSSAGVAVNDPVIDADGLIGTVTRVAAIGSTVTLIDDPTANEGARDDSSGEVGLIAPDVGNPDLLQLKFVRDVTKLKVGDLIVTAGGSVTGHATLFPPNVPIGTVTSLPGAGDVTGTVTVTPSADLGALDQVQVLTRVAR